MLTSAQFIRLPQVKEITSLSKSSIYRLMEEGDFPKQVVFEFVDDITIRNSQGSKEHRAFAEASSHLLDSLKDLHLHV